MKKKMTDKHKIMAYVLSTDAELNRDKNITQEDISNLFGVSQPTVAQAVKEAKLKIRIDNLEMQLTKVKEEVLKVEGINDLGIPKGIEGEYRRKL